MDIEFFLFYYCFIHLTVECKLYTKRLSPICVYVNFFSLSIKRMAHSSLSVKPLYSNSCPVILMELYHYKYGFMGLLEEDETYLDNQQLASAEPDVHCFQKRSHLLKTSRTFSVVNIIEN